LTFQEIIFMKITPSIFVLCYNEFGIHDYNIFLLHIATQEKRVDSDEYSNSC